MGRRCFLFTELLLPEHDLTGLVIHRFHDSQRFQMIAQIADNLTANLEALLDGNADTLHSAACLVNNGNQTLQRTAVGKEIVDDQHVVVFRQKLLGNHNGILVLVGKGFHLSGVGITGNVDGLGLLCKEQRYFELLCYRISNSNAGSLNGEDFVDGLALESLVEFLADLIHQGNIHLVIEKAVNLQYITFLYNAVFYDSCFQTAR